MIRRTAAACCMLAALALPALAGAQARNWPSEGPPPPLAPRPFTFPPYEVRTLPNGMQVIAVLHHEQPAVSMRLLIRAGAAQDAHGKRGVATLTAALLDQGTTTKNAFQVADAIDSIGGAMGTGAGSDLSFVNVVVMKDSFGLAMNLLADVVRNPAFAPEEIERQKQQALSALQVSATDPDSIAGTVFDRLVYGFHPYGLPTGGTPESIASITREDVQAFHRSYFVPNNMILAIVGDVTGEEAFSTAQKIFGSWARAEVPAAKAVEPPPPTRRVIVIDKPDAVQTEVRAGHIAIPRKHQDYAAMDLAVKILGGEGANRLFRVLRSERGLTYGASADLEALKQTGNVVAETDTQTNTTGEAVRLMVEEFSRLQRERVSARELGDAQAYLAGSFPLKIETPDAIATQVLNTIFYELPVEEIPTYRERVQAVTPDDVQRVARQYIKPQQLSMVLVGNAKAFIPQLRSVGFTDFEVIPVQDLDLMSVSLRREPGRTGGVAAWGGSVAGAPRAAYAPGSAQAARTTAPDAKVDPRAVELVRRVVNAKGGADRLRKIRTVVAEADTSFKMEAGALSSPTRTYVVYPDKFRVDAVVGEAEVTQVYDAGQAWMRDPRGVQDAPPDVRNEFAASVRRDIIPLLLAALDGSVVPRLLPEEGSSGRVLKVLELSGLQVPAVRLYIDEQNLVAKQTFTVAGPDGRSAQAQETFSDYRSVDGVQVAFRAEVARNGRTIVERTLKSVVFNGPVDDKLFTRPR